MASASSSLVVNIFTFVPNLIGYGRVILLIASLFFMVSRLGVWCGVCVCVCVWNGVFRLLLLDSCSSSLLMMTPPPLVAPPPSLFLFSSHLHACHFCA